MNKRTLSCLIGGALLIPVLALWIGGGSREDHPGALAGTGPADQAEHAARLESAPRSSERDSTGVLVHVTTPSGAPVLGAEVEFLAIETNEFGLGTTSPTGELQLPGRGTYMIRARAPGFAPVPLFLALGPGSAIQLTPVGSLHILLPGVLPTAAAEIEVELLPPDHRRTEETLTGRAAIAEVRRITGRAMRERASSNWVRAWEALEAAVDPRRQGARAPADLMDLFTEFDRAYPYDTALDPRSLRRPVVDGRARFDDLPAGRGYRYVLHAGFPITASPPNEAPPVVFNGNGTITPQEGLLPQNLSGTFAIVADEVLTISVEASTPGSVRGLLAGFDPTHDAVNVALRHWEAHVNPVGGLSYTSGLIDLEVEPEADGTFHLAPVRTGTKRLQIRQVSPGRETAYVLREFQLAPGEHRDLGVLEPAGASLECTLGFVTEDGDRREVEELFATPPSAGIAIQELDPAAPHLADYLHVPLGAPFTLRGLVPGRYRLKAFLDRETAESLLSPYAFDRSIERVLMVDVEGAGLTQVAFDLVVSKAKTFVTLIARDRQGGAWTHNPRARFLSPTKVEEFLLRTRRGAERIEEVRLTPGPYRVVCNVPGDVNLHCVRDVVIPDSPQHTLELDLTPGVILNGRLLTEDGNPAPNVTLQFALDPGSETVFWVATNSEGHYELSGLQPNTRLWPRTNDWNAEAPIQVSAQPGPMTADDLRLH